MTPHQILIVAIRLLAIYWLLGVLGQLAPAIATMDELGADSAMIGVPLAVQLAICLFLWLFPATLASMLLRDGGSPVSAGSVPFAQWRDLLFVTVGIFILARSIPGVVYWVILGGASEPAAPDFTFEQKISAFVTYLELAIGIGLVFGASGIGSLLQKLRTAGIP